MKKVFFVVAGLFMAVAVPGMFAPSMADTVSDSGKKLIQGESLKKSSASVTASSLSVADQIDSAAKSDFDSKYRQFWSKGELKVGVEKWYGDNTYQIGFPVYDYPTATLINGYFPFSELEFPLDVVMFSAQYDVEIKKRWMFSLSFKTDLDHFGDDMEDRDWLTASNPDQLDVFSTSNVTSFQAIEFDANAKFKYLQGANWSLDAGVGYLFQEFKYDTALKLQYSPSGLAGFDAVGDGQTSSIKYEIFYKIPYVQIGGAVTFAKRFSIAANVSYAPWVEAEDEDQHLLRDKVNRGDLDGDSWMANLEGRYQISRHWFVALEYGYKEIKVDGKMIAEFSYLPAPDHWVSEEQESIQHSGSLMFGYSY